jgi:hypothetical protein
VHQLFIHRAAWNAPSITIRRCTSGLAEAVRRSDTSPRYCSEMGLACTVSIRNLEGCPFSSTVALDLVVDPRRWLVTHRQAEGEVWPTVPSDTKAKSLGNSIGTIYEGHCGVQSRSEALKSEAPNWLDSADRSSVLSLHAA